MQLGAAAHLAPESLRLVGPGALITFLAGSGLEFATVNLSVGVISVDNRRRGSACRTAASLCLRFRLTLAFPLRLRKTNVHLEDGVRLLLALQFQRGVMAEIALLAVAVAPDEMEQADSCSSGRRVLSMSIPDLVELLQRGTIRVERRPS